MYGEKVVALGCDFDGCDQLPIGIDGLGDMYRLADRMLPSDTGRKPFAVCSMTMLSRLYRKCCDNRLYFFAFRYCRTIPVCYTIIRYGFSMRRSTTRSIQYHCGGYDKWIM